MGTMPATIAQLVQTYGYWAVLLAVGLESLGVPIPGETTLIAAALYAGATHRLSLVGGADVANIAVGSQHLVNLDELRIRHARGDILVIHTGYHRYYPENWTDRSEADETKYFIRHPGPARAFAEWVLERGVRWIAVDAGSADHPMNTVIRRIRADEAEEAEKKLDQSLDEVFPKADYQIMHTLLFPHDIIHIENLGGQIDEVLDRKILFGCFPWRFQGGEAALCRAVAILEE